MKYLQLFTNKYSLALLALFFVGIACLMASSEWTWIIIVSKVIGLALLILFSRLFTKWECDGRIDFIYDLFNDDEMTGEQPYGDPEEHHYHGDE